MGDDIERYVRDHRIEFDDELPSESVWIEVEQKSRKMVSIRSNIWKVAAVLFLVSTVFLLVERTGIINTSNQVSKNIELSEFDEVESYYVKLINKKREEVITMSTKKVKRDFLIELEQLDEVYEELKTLSKEQNTTNVLTNAMITNLQMRIEVLNKQLNILKSLQTTNYDTESNIEV